MDAMSRGSSDGSIVTPEAVALTLDVAGLGSRMIALIIDSLIQGALAVLAFLLFVPAFSALDLSPAAGTVGIVVSLFLILWGYFPFFEALFNGTTPGKRAQRLRVIQADGQPARLSAILLRNLLRIVDFLPAYYALGAITMIATAKSQRIGDLVAGTIVVRDRKAPPPISESYEPPSHTIRVDATGLTERDYGVVRAFLQRRATLDPAARADLAHRLATTIKNKIAGDVGVIDDEAFLEAVGHAYRERFASPGEI